MQAFPDEPRWPSRFVASKQSDKHEITLHHTHPNTPRQMIPDATHPNTPRQVIPDVFIQDMAQHLSAYVLHCT